MLVYKNFMVFYFLYCILYTKLYFDDLKKAKSKNLIIYKPFSPFFSCTNNFRTFFSGTIFNLFLPFLILF